MMIDYKENLINENSELNLYDGTMSRKRTHKIDKF